MRACGPSVLFALILGVATSSAATVDIVPTDESNFSIIIIDGPLELGDEAEFADAAVRVRTGVVVLDSPGGNLIAGIEIGRAIRLKGFATVVPEGFNCSSACALAWLGGRRRFMADGARVGFHAASADGSVDSVANALVGAYLNQIGLPIAAIAFITAAQPDEIRWLTFEEANRVGIEVERFALGTSTERHAPYQSSSLVYGDWSSYGRWVQTHSRASIDEAQRLAADLRKQHGNTFVFLYDNGWYAVAIGPFDPSVATHFRDMEVSLGRIPGDSIVVSGTRFVALVGGNGDPKSTLDRRGELPDGGLVGRAREAAKEFFRVTSLPNYAATRALDKLYADRLLFFGKAVSKAEAMKEKQVFMARWPQRNYVARPESLQVRCNDVDTCLVTGLFDWTAYSPERDSTSVGVGRFELTLRLDERTTVVGESSEVLSRELISGRAP